MELITLASCVEDIEAMLVTDPLLVLALFAAETLERNPSKYEIDAYCRLCAAKALESDGIVDAHLTNDTLDATLERVHRRSGTQQTPAQWFIELAVRGLRVMMAAGVAEVAS